MKLLRTLYTRCVETWNAGSSKLRQFCLGLNGSLSSPQTPKSAFVSYYLRGTDPNLLLSFPGLRWLHAGVIRALIDGDKENKHAVFFYTYSDSLPRASAWARSTQADVVQQLKTEFEATTDASDREARVVDILHRATLLGCDIELEIKHMNEALHDVGLVPDDDCGEEFTVLEDR